MISHSVKTSFRLVSSNRVNSLRRLSSPFLRRSYSDGSGKEWDFLAQRQSTGETSILEDSYALKQDTEIISDDTHIRRSSSEPNTPNGGTFKQPKKRMSMDGSKPDTSATKHEQAIFAEIFSSILKNTSSSTNNNIPYNKPSKMSSGMQALFEKAFSQSPTKTDSLESGDDRSDSKDVRLGFTTQDIRKTPLSMTPTMQQPLKGALNISQLFEIQIVIKKKFEPVIKYLNELETDHEVCEFYTKRVLDEFPKQLEAKQNEKSKDSSDTKAKSEIEGIENMDITVDKFPVNYHTLSYLLQETLRILSEDFGSPMEAIALFELTKSQSVNSYVAGCNVAVYNEILKIKWGAFRDLYLIETLISEMKVNGITANSKTSETLAWIAESAKAMKNATLDNGAPATNLWTSEDEERLTNISTYRLQTMQQLYSNYQEVKNDNIMSSLLQ